MRDWIRDMAVGETFPSIPIFNSEFLSLLSATVSAWLLNGFGVEFMREGVYLFTPSGSVQFQVADICSGLKSLYIITFFAAVYGFIIHKSALRIFLLLLLSAPLAVAANVFRIVILCLIAHFLGQETTAGFIHEVPGLVLFYIIVIFMMWLGDTIVSKVGKRT